MFEFLQLVCHFAGNILKYCFYFGQKSIDEVAEEDNSLLGFIFIIIVILIV